MGLIQNSSEISVEFKPWTDAHFRITRLQLVEQLGGNMPTGEIDLFLDGTDDSVKNITEENTGKLEIKTEKEIGNSYVDIKVYILERQYFGNALYLKFVVTDDIKFLTERITTYYPKDMTLKEKIKATFPGKAEEGNDKNIRIEPDVPDILLYQNCETNYEFNKRLCLSYKKDSIFAYGWEGLLLKDMKGDFDHFGNHEPDKELQLEANRLTLQGDTYHLKYNKRTNHDPFNPWEAPEDSTTKTDYSDVSSRYFQTVMNYKEYKVVGKDLEQYLSNAWHNGRLLENGGYTHFEVNLTDIPNFKLGDVLIYQRRAEQHEKIPWTLYLVTSNELFYTIDATRKTNKDNFRFAWTSKLMGLEDGKWNEKTD